MNDHFEQNYVHLIESSYRSRSTTHFESDSTYPHQYSVLHREDFTMYETYSIDPDGCEDADDAFSIFVKDNTLFLAIHIADPTEYINLESNTWKDIINNVVTQYPSNRKPIHMMPIKIMEKASLLVNDEGDIKNAITVLVSLNIDTYIPETMKLLFTTIRVKNENALSYKKASESIFINNDIYNALQISIVLQKLRSTKTIGTKLNEISHSYVTFKNGIPFLQKDGEYEIVMKQMIAEFAILANSFVGEYLKLNMEGKGIFRTCSAKEWLLDKKDLSGDELLNEIISNGIRAEYLSTNASHDLVGMPEYAHFTSPIRRMSDCVCHYLLKFIYLRKENPDLKMPFNNKELDKLANSCLSVTKSMKQLQYKDTKFRLIQSMYYMLCVREQLSIQYYITSYTGLFLNLIICKINNHDVHLSYTLRTKKQNFEFDNKKMYNLHIKTVQCPGIYDGGSIPELDDEIFKFLTSS
tara:strand:- start:5604 stop:7007 length:1404 start_codon:yes stop_codon:yes gene_type:complete